MRQVPFEVLMHAEDALAYSNQALAMLEIWMDSSAKVMNTNLTVWPPFSAWCMSQKIVFRKRGRLTVQNDFVSDVRSKANGYWPSILERLAIPTNRGEGPCPACGGKTRYRFDNKDNRGTYFCSHCGAGTGLDLVMKVNQCGAREAAELVAEAMALPMPEPKPAREKPQTDIAGKVAALVAKASPGSLLTLHQRGFNAPSRCCPMGRCCWC
jgi:hypothetical protein